MAGLGTAAKAAHGGKCRIGRCFKADLHPILQLLEPNQARRGSWQFHLEISIFGHPAAVYSMFEVKPEA